MMKDQLTRQARRHARARAQRERKRMLIPLGVVLAVILLVVVLVQPRLNTASLHKAGAESKSAKVVTSEKTKSSSEQSQTKKQQVESRPKALWNSDKEAQLDAYIQKWQVAMGQHYQRYYPESSAGPLNFYGVSYPADFSKQAINVAGRSLSVATSKTGRGKADFNVVAIYSDIQQAPMNGHLYLFGFENDEPHVLITQQNQGMPDGKVHFTDTANRDLADNFRQIVMNQSKDEEPDATAPSQSSQIQSDQDQQIAV